MSNKLTLTVGSKVRYTSGHISGWACIVQILTLPRPDDARYPGIYLLRDTLTNIECVVTGEQIKTTPGAL